MDKNTSEDFEKTLCKNCGHKKVAHYTFSMIPEGEPTPGIKCKECDCKKFLSRKITEWVNQPKHKSEWKNKKKHETKWKSKEKS